jgi:hypothetical protein
VKTFVQEMVFVLMEDAYVNLDIMGFLAILQYHVTAIVQSEIVSARVIENVNKIIR